MQTVILAAGVGKRLKELTKNHTKCMVEINGRTLIERAMENLCKAGMDRIIIVTGYKGDVLKEYVEKLDIRSEVVFVNNDRFGETNNIYSLWLTKDYLVQDDTIVLESDIIFDGSMVETLVKNENDCVTFVARPEPWMDGTIVKLDVRNNITEFIDNHSYDMNNINEYYKTVSIYKFSREFIEKKYMPLMEAYIKAWGDSSVYESALKVVTMGHKTSIPALVVSDERWYEINDIQDVDIAESIFAEGIDKVNKYSRRFGGYWRYPAMHDFCYLVNPYFPNVRFMNEMKANFETLIREYPSGMGVNSLLAGKYFDILPEYVCVGNGTAELIKSLMENLHGRIGTIYPTFEEYSHRKKVEDIVPYYVKENDFNYTVKDLMDFYEINHVEAIVLINPDNPSGNFIKKPDILELAKWAAVRNTLLVVDESFIDFAKDCEKHTLISNEILEDNPNLIVLKSISKSFGVAGLRLGIIVSSDKDRIAFMKKDVAIWNINSFAEYYMQIIEKYKEDYEEAMEHIKVVRDDYIEQLQSIKQLHVYPSQANYVMCRIKSDITSTQLADVMLNKYNILIKDLSRKDGLDGGNYIRLSVKNEEENAIMIKALREIFD